MQTTALPTLPDEILLYIFEILDASRPHPEQSFMWLANVARSNKLFQAIVTPLRFSRIFFQPDTNWSTQLPSLEECLRNHGQEVKTLVFHLERLFGILQYTGGTSGIQIAVQCGERIGRMVESCGKVKSLEFFTADEWVCREANFEATKCREWVERRSEWWTPMLSSLRNRPTPINLIWGRDVAPEFSKVSPLPCVTRYNGPRPIGIAEPTSRIFPNLKEMTLAQPRWGQPIEVPQLLEVHLPVLTKFHISWELPISTIESLLSRGLALKKVSVFLKLANSTDNTDVTVTLLSDLDDTQRGRQPLRPIPLSPNATTIDHLVLRFRCGKKDDLSALLAPTWNMLRKLDRKVVTLTFYCQIQERDHEALAAKRPERHNELKSVFAGLADKVVVKSANHTKRWK